uniref:Uncharacterized protein n=1 Tax=Glossina pallidipes TaxID=7398 RepID=A0A1A9ZQ62_GLOPL
MRRQVGKQQQQQQQQQSTSPQMFVVVPDLKFKRKKNSKKNTNNNSMWLKTYQIQAFKLVPLTTLSSKIFSLRAAASFHLQLKARDLGIFYVIFGNPLASSLLLATADHLLHLMIPPPLLVFQLAAPPYPFLNWNCRDCYRPQDNS